MPENRRRILPFLVNLNLLRMDFVILLLSNNERKAPHAFLQFSFGLNRQASVQDFQKLTDFVLGDIGQGFFPPPQNHFNVNLVAFFQELLGEIGPNSHVVFGNGEGKPDAFDLSPFLLSTLFLLLGLPVKIFAVFGDLTNRGKGFFRDLDQVQPLDLSHFEGFDETDDADLFGVFVD